MSVLNIAVVGLGFIGHLHARIIYETANANLVAIADINTKLGEQISSKYQCAFYSDYNAMFNECNLDAVSICVPDKYHFEVAQSAAKNKINILIEKPLAKTQRECESILSIVKQNNVRLMVAHLLRFDPRYVQLQESIDRGDLGKIIHMNFRRNFAFSIFLKLKKSLGKYPVVLLNSREKCENDIFAILRDKVLISISFSIFFSIKFIVFIILISLYTCDICE